MHSKLIHRVPAKLTQNEQYQGWWAEHPAWGGPRWRHHHLQSSECAPLQDKGSSQVWLRLRTLTRDYPTVSEWDDLITPILKGGKPFLAVVTGRRWLGGGLWAKSCGGLQKLGKTRRCVLPKSLQKGRHPCWNLDSSPQGLIMDLKGKRCHNPTAPWDFLPEDRTALNLNVNYPRWIFFLC